MLHGGTMKSLLVIPLLFLTYCASSPVQKENPTSAKVDKCIEGDCINGQGTMEYTDGRKYTGGWKDGKRHGSGVMAYSDGWTLKAIWVNGKIEGHLRGTRGDEFFYGTYLNGINFKDPVHNFSI